MAQENSFYDMDKVRAFQESFKNRDAARSKPKEKYDQKNKSVYDDMEKQKVIEKYKKP